MKRYIFTIAIQGEGEDKDKAWDDAVVAFIADPGPTPDDPSYIYEIEDDEEDGN